MTAKNFSKIIGISRSRWSTVLNDKGALSFDNATSVSELLNTSIELWLNPTPPAGERKKAWMQYQAHRREA